MPHRAFIGIGSNLGDRAENYRQAIVRIAALPKTQVVRQSSIYETEPVGELKGAFLNGVIEIATEMNADALLRQLLAIEQALGRRRQASSRRAPKRPLPRTIDLDLLFFDNEVINSAHLVVPHPRLHERRFVLAPMAELAPSLTHPQSNKTISELLAQLKSPQRVTLARAELLRP